MGKKEDEARQLLQLQAIGEISRGLIHEVNNDLMVILSGAKILQSSVEEAPLQRTFVDEWTSSIEASCNKLIDVLSGVIAVSRDSSGETAAGCSLNEITSMIHTLVKGNFKKLGITLKISIDSELAGAPIKVPQGKLTQVLLALVLGGKRRLEGCKEKWIDIAARRQGESLQLVITDSSKKRQSDGADDPYFGLALALAGELGGTIEIKKEVVCTIRLF
jgi:C4-dicarboxylate-specific signal transduction histidine kinase